MRLHSSLTAFTALTMALTGVALSGCSKHAANGGIVAVDGSSTVYPISEAVAEELAKRSPTKVTIGVSGTGGGLKKLCSGTIAVAAASRPIKDVEMKACTDGGIEFIELPVAYDGIAVVVHPDNTWATSITVAELKKIWEPSAQGKVMRWSDVREGWPQEEMHLFGAGVDSGTYDYFTQAIVGKEHSSRGDFTSSEDDNVLVQGVAGDKLALGFFGLAYFEANAKKLKLVSVDDGTATNGDGPIVPTVDTVTDGTYQPLARPLFLYVAQSAAAQPEVQAYVDAYLTDGPRLVREVGYVALPPKAYELAKKRLASRTPGTIFGGAHGSQVGVSIVDLLAKEGGG